MENESNILVSKRKQNPLKGITDIKVNVRVFSFADGRTEVGDICVSWNSEGFRFHYWVKDGVPGETFFKNVPMDDPRYKTWRTKHLRVNNKSNKEMIEAIHASIDFKSEIEKAKILDAERIRDEQAKRDEESRIDRIKESGPELLRACKNALGCFWDEDGWWENQAEYAKSSNDVRQEIIHQLKLAISKAEGTES